MSSCTRCKRGLTDPISIKRGYGPVCWAKAQAEKEKEEAAKQQEYSGPYDGGDIILERRNGTAFINVPHAIVRHSPSGYEWGYGGSGPADAALNILLAVTGNKELAMRHYQDFKWTFIAAMPEEGGTIRRDDILSWLKEVE